MKFAIIGLCIFLSITVAFASQSSKLIEKKSKSKNEITKQLPVTNGQFSKTIYTIDQVDLIICDHREASFTFKCGFEYARIDLKFGLEENRRQRICSEKRNDSVKICKSLQFLGCHPDIGLEQWCIDRKSDIDEQRKFWHMSIGQICHKNLVKHTKLCKNGKKKIKEGDKHISAVKIGEFYEKNKPRKTTIKPVPHPKPTTVVHVEHETIPEQPDFQILINYIFGKSQFSIKKPDLVIFLNHVFKEKTTTHKPISVPAFVEHVINEGVQQSVKPNIAFSKVNPTLTELLLDYIYGTSRPHQTQNEIQLFIDYLFEEKQKRIEETKLRTIFVEVLIGYKPFSELSPTVILPIQPVPVKEPIKLLTTRKPHYSSKPLKVVTTIIKPKPTKSPVVTAVPKDEFDVSFIFKIADELVTFREGIENLNSNGESNLENYNFLVGPQSHQINNRKKIDDNDFELDNNETNKENKIFIVKMNKNEAINDLKRSLGGY